MANPQLRKTLEEGGFISAPGAFDMMSVKIADRIGFDALYASGYWLTASYLGLPDAGIATYTDMRDRVAKFCELASTPVIADADTGYGGLLNLHHTVKGYEKAGVSGFQFEDQEFPKQCGHVGRRRVIPMDEMVRKIGVVLDARTDTNMLVIARTDARSNHGLAAAIERGQAYAEAGADVVFVEALESPDEMREACATIDAPLLANMADGGSTPILHRDELIDIGYRAAIYPAISALSAMAAVEKSLLYLRDHGKTRDESIAHFDFKEMCSLLGFGDVHEFEDRWLDD